MAFRSLFSVLLVAAIVSDLRSEDELKDFDFVGSDSDEVMIAQESRHYQTFVKPPVRIVKPTGVTNSHRPQYNLDSLEDGLADIEEFLETTTRRTVAYKPSYKVRSKESMIKDAVLRALERKDQVGKFAQILPIIRAMSGSQRVALASLVASQVTTPPGRPPLNLAQVRSMFGNNINTTTDLMLPILLDTANLIRRAVRPGKQAREVIQPLPQAQMLRRSFNEDDSYFDDDIDTEVDKDNDTTSDPQTNEHDDNKSVEHTENKITERGTKPTIHNDIKTTTTTPISLAQRLRSRRIIQRASQARRVANQPQQDHNRTTVTDTKQADSLTVTSDTQNEDNNFTNSAVTTESIANRGRSAFRSGSDNSSVDLAADATNQTLVQDLPLPEKLRSLNRYVDRKGIRRGPPPKPITRRTTAEPTLSPVTRRRPSPPRKLPTVATEPQTKCELFTNTLCLHAEDYPTDAIVQSIRRNKAAAGALLADFRDPGEGAVDGVSADQEAKYTADHYLTSNRRGDTANRDFASAGEAGFMCPSTVKYARPQRARATSGQWKYIVNTGEHTQTLRLEKCLKPKESCTYLTDNFKSKCVQVYNYHRLLTWDQQNGLHMDIFKVPTCCSCHIEGYSVSFPPVGHRVHETSSAEQFPAGEDLSSEHGNQAFESVQPSIHRPSVSKSPPFTHGKPLETFPPFSDNHNLISGIGFSKSKLNENDATHTNPMDSYGNTYFPDSFDQPSSIRNIKRPSTGRLPVIPSGSNNFDSVTLPSYLEPPTPVGPNSFTFIKETPTKYKITGSKFKRGPVVRPKRRPIRKKISTGPEDLISSGTAAIESYSDPNYETLEEFSDDLEESDVGQASVLNTPKRVTITPKLQTVTTENPVSTTFRLEENNADHENYNSEEIRINYNYHPIIDFFGESDKESNNDSIDREDIEPSYVSTVQSEWKPINNPPPRNVQNSNFGSRKNNN